MSTAKQTPKTRSDYIREALALDFSQDTTKLVKRLKKEHGLKDLTNQHVYQMRSNVKIVPSEKAKFEALLGKSIPEGNHRTVAASVPVVAVPQSDVEFLEDTPIASTHNFTSEEVMQILNAPESVQTLIKKLIQSK